MNRLIALGLVVAACSPAQAYQEKYDALLKAYVDDKGLVDYAAFKKKDEATLKACVAAMAKVDTKTLDAAAKKAYWINVYNAVTLKAMLEFFPLQSIKDKVSSIPGFYDLWDDYGFGKKKLSLNHIEHKILRPMGDPRIHAAIVCASLGCPILRNEAYVGAQLDAQLDDNCKNWLADTKRGLELKGTVAKASNIFSWFGDDFAEDDAGRLAWIAQYTDEKTAKRLKSGKVTLGSLDWDWALNKQ